MRFLLIHDFKITCLHSNKRYSKRILRSLWDLIPTIHNWSCAFEVKFIVWTFTSFYICVKRKHVSNVNMSVPKSNFERHFTTYALRSCKFLARPQFERGCCTFRLLFKKYITYFEFFEVKILVGKWNIYETHIFKSSSVKNLFANEKFVFKYPVTGKKNSTLSIFFWNLGKSLSYMCSTPNI